MIVEAFKKLIEHYNEIEKCDFCWEFEAPLRVSDINESVKKSNDDDCCVRVFLTNLRFSDTNRKPNIFQEQRKRIIERATVYFLMYDNIGKNTWQEMKGHNLSESKYHTIIKPLYDCLRSLDFCGINDSILIEDISGSTKIDYLADNYTGWQFDITISYL